MPVYLLLEREFWVHKNFFTHQKRFFLLFDFGLQTLSFQQEHQSSISISPDRRTVYTFTLRLMEAQASSKSLEGAGAKNEKERVARVSRMI